MSLSAKFAALSSARSTRSNTSSSGGTSSRMISTSTSVVASGRNRRQQTQRATATVKRSNATQARRGLQPIVQKKPVQASPGRGRGAGAVRGVKVAGKGRILRGKKGASSSSSSSSSNSGVQANKGKGRGRGRGGNEQKGEADPADLDKAMDSYWFKAGKGPDPEQAALDRQMESYMKAKPKAAASGEGPAVVTQA